jgi:hypothetical protein
MTDFDIESDCSHHGGRGVFACFCFSLFVRLSDLKYDMFVFLSASKRRNQRSGLSLQLPAGEARKVPKEQRLTAARS